MYRDEPNYCYSLNRRKFSVRRDVSSICMNSTAEMTPGLRNLRGKKINTREAFSNTEKEAQLLGSQRGRKQAQMFLFHTKSEEKKKLSSDAL